MLASPQGLPGTREAGGRAGLGAGRRPAGVEGAVGRAGRATGQTEARSPSLGPDVPLPVPRLPGAQENLLLSVLPAHISMGMKLAIIERLKERGDRRYMPDNNFHSLYVKRHQNVRWVAGWACVRGPPGGWPQSPHLFPRGVGSDHIGVGGDPVAPYSCTTLCLSSTEERGKKGEERGPFR